MGKLAGAVFLWGADLWGVVEASIGGGLAFVGRCGPVGESVGGVFWTVFGGGDDYFYHLVGVVGRVCNILAEF